MRDDCRLLGNTKIVRFAIGALYSSRMKAGSYRAYVTESGDTVENVMLPATFSSMTGLVNRVTWGGVRRKVWGRRPASRTSTLINKKCRLEMKVRSAVPIDVNIPLQLAEKDIVR
ncbi:hypothetical protein CRENBAI_003497 [Crenichthys baileyi]|uniref:Uncharacterized protein n=1 Tax=Crenichthys baileyi TaxID=28760 RepID=A0AAV9RVA2_9TELE